MSLESLFEEHFPKPEQHFTDLWANAIFVLDTNVLLNLYRYSDKTRDKLLEILEKLRDRLWIPYWVGREYVKNRPSTISSQVSEITPITALTAFISTFEAKRKQPHLADDIKQQLIDIENSINEANARTKDLLKGRIRNDDIMRKLVDIFGENIGTEPTAAELDALVEQGEARAKTNTPPGFADYEKKKKEDPKNRFAPVGDYIIWDAMKKKAIADDKPIIFISDDEEKADWILKFSGETLGPLPALLKEFKKETKYDFHIYNSFQFLNLYQDQPGEQVDKEVLDELKEFAEINIFHDKSSIEYVDTDSSVPHFEILRNQDGSFIWRFTGEGNAVWFTSQVNFGDVTSCISNIDNIRQYARLPRGFQVTRFADGSHLLGIHNSQGINEVHSYLGSRDREQLEKMIPTVAKWVPNRNIVFI